MRPESGKKRSSEEALFRQNSVLAVLPNDEFAHVVAQAELVEVTARTPVYEPGGRIDAVQFPLTAVFSVVAVVAGETSIEVATVGREGMVGLPLFLGATSSPNSAFCQIAGRSLRLSARAFGEVLAADGALHRQIHRFVQATMVQLAQNVACNRLHTAEQRASRWLLMTQDRVGENEFLLTQEFLAQMIGVRRATVSAVASALQRDGLIRYSRGQITVIDRGRLEASACECYGVVRAEFDALRRRK